MVKSKEEIMTSLKGVIGESTDENVLTLLEDIDDTLSVDNSAAVKELEDWKNKYNALDEDWKKRYRDRFFGDVDETEDVIFKDDETEEKLTYESLFEEEKEGGK